MQFVSKADGDFFFEAIFGDIAKNFGRLLFKN